MHVTAVRILNQPQILGHLQHFFPTKICTKIFVASCKFIDLGEWVPWGLPGIVWYLESILHDEPTLTFSLFLSNLKLVCLTTMQNQSHPSNVLATRSSQQQQQPQPQNQSCKPLFLSSRYTRRFWTISNDNLWIFSILKLQIPILKMPPTTNAELRAVNSGSVLLGIILFLALSTVAAVVIACVRRRRSLNLGAYQTWVPGMPLQRWYGHWSM